MSAIIYNCYNGNGMAKYVLDLNNIIPYIPKGKECQLVTNIKSHCGDDKEFILKIKNGKIVNKELIDEINKYIESNNTRSFFYEGFASLGNGRYCLMWSS